MGEIRLPGCRLGLRKIVMVCCTAVVIAAIAGVTEQRALGASGTGPAKRIVGRSFGSYAPQVTIVGPTKDIVLGRRYEYRVEILSTRSFANMVCVFDVYPGRETHTSFRLVAHHLTVLRFAARFTANPGLAVGLAISLAGGPLQAKPNGAEVPTVEVAEQVFISLAPRPHRQ
jgi:hypothetical protein